MAWLPPRSPADHRQRVVRRDQQEERPLLVVVELPQSHVADSPSTKKKRKRRTKIASLMRISKKKVMIMMKSQLLVRRSDPVSLVADQPHQVEEHQNHRQAEEEHQCTTMKRTIMNLGAVLPLVVGAEGLLLAEEVAVAKLLRTQTRNRVPLHVASLP
jgi:hypothetical protein